MASLTDQLPTIDRGRATAEPVREASIFTGLAGAVSEGMDAFATASRVSAQAAASRRQAENDARTARDRSAENDAATSWIDVVHPRMRAAAEAASASAAGLAPMVAGVDQGRITRDSLELRADMEYRRLIAAHPGSEAVILQAYRENGLQSPLMREYREAADDLNDQREFYREDRQKLLDVASTTLGLTISPTDPPSRQEEILSAARVYVAGKTRAEAAAQQLQLRTAQRNLTDLERQDAERQYSNNATQAGLNMAAGNLQGISVAITQIIDDPNIPEAVKQQRIGTIVARARSAATLMLNAFFTEGPGAHMSNEDKTFLTGRVNALVQNLDDMVTGDHSFFARQHQQLQMMQDRLGIDMAQALPIFSQVRALVGSTVATDAFFTSILQNTQLTASIRQELQNYSGISQNEQQTRIMNVARLMAGNEDLRNFSPPEAKRMVQQFITPTVLGLIGNRDAVFGRDADAHRSLVIAEGQLANAAVDATPQWGRASLSAGLQNITNPSMIRALTVATANPSERRMVTTGTLPAVQRMMSALQQAPSNDPYYSIRFNQRSGRFEAQRNNTPANVQSSQSQARFGNLPGFSANPQMLNETTRAVNSLNLGLNFQMAMSQHGYDQSMPASVSHRDRLLYYATGRMPPSAAHAANQARVNTTEQNFRNVEQAVDRFVTSLPLNPQGEMEDVAGAINGAENSTGNTNARNPNSTATGNGQFIESTWIDTVTRHAPGLVQGKSRAEILALRSDPELSHRMTAAYAQDNQAYLAERGVPNGAAELSLAHFAGPAGAVAILRAAPDTPIEQIMSAAEIRANSFLRGKTAAEVRQWAAQRIRRSA